MKILHILNDGPSGLSARIIREQSREHDIRVVDISKRDVSYESIVEDIFSHDRVISW
ncbi:MAG: hypothetical protein M0Z60_05255 [Nitrospiraceae bacterium]|nr:hypothetical protein [Nitrospiraceae bacterium]